jgi:tryptophan-rich sensory protein
MSINVVRGAVDRVANSRGRSTQHILLGLGLTVGAVAAATLVARLYGPDEDEHEVYSDYEEPEAEAPKPRPKAFAMIWPPLFMALTLSGLRVWNAPRSPERTQALTLWGVVQGLNVVWMALGARRLGGELAAAVTGLSAAAAYVWRARQVDPPAANMVAPYIGWIGFANVLSEQLWRKKPAPSRRSEAWPPQLPETWP